MNSFSLSCLMLATVFCSSVIAADHVKLPETTMTGKELFAHKWSMEEGLGPLFNETSCIGCHFQSGPGGGGSNDKNVDLLTVDVPSQMSDQYRSNFAQRVIKTHPHFTTNNSSIVFHKFALDPEYPVWRGGVLGFAPPKRSAGLARQRALLAYELRRRESSPLATFQHDGVTLIMSTRNTPALFGAGLLDQVPDETPIDIAKSQESLASGVSGRFAGKFGWRGQTRSLAAFVMGACGNEIGLQGTRHKQSKDPLSMDFVNATNDLSDADGDKLIAFVAALPRPRRIIPGENLRMQAMLSNGESVFHSIGCAECHVPDLGNAKDVFSDLLLHDLGPALGDPVTAPQGQRLIGQIQDAGSGYFGGGTRDIFEPLDSNLTQEWKTPPLWGCADSGPYLHDGRAATLHEAIMLHAGEAEQSRRRYVDIDAASRSRMLAFLSTLHAPQRREM